MSIRVDLTGQKFGRLKVIRFSGKNKYRGAMWDCLCDCGTSVIVRGQDLKSGATKSCGCLVKEIAANRSITHSHTRNRRCSRTYTCWNNMKSRCYNSNTKGYKDYGGRGITICERWTEKTSGFINFLNDMGECPEGLTIERINNEGNYEPTNCKWAPQSEQNNNTRANRFLTFNGETHTITQWSKITGIPGGILRERILRGWSEERALTTPVKNFKKKKIDT